MYTSFFELYIPSFQKKDSIEKENNRKRRKDDGTEKE
jgi:PadR family transcriptional regulator PadR